jgi:hypothetical protein
MVQERVFRFCGLGRVINHQNRDTGADDRKAVRYEKHPAFRIVTYGGSKKQLRIPLENLSRNITIDALMLPRRITPEDGICAGIRLGAG